MNFKSVGNKRDDIRLVVKNEDTVTLSAGQAAFLNGLNGTDDGLAVVGGNNLGTNFSAALTLNLLYGVVLNDIPANGIGEVIAFGYCANIRFTQATRAASSGANNWATQASIAAFAPLYPETTANGWTTAAAQSFVTGSTAAAGIAITQFAPPIVLGQSIGTMASSATATSDTRTAVTLMVKGFVRIL